MVIVDLVYQRNNTLQAAYTSGTKQNLATQWDTYVDFCNVYQNCRLQADVESLSLFIQFISNRLTSPGTVLNYVSGVKTMHVICGLDIEMFDDYLIKMMIRGIKVTKCHVPKKASRVTPSMLLKFREVLDLTQPSDCSFWALFVLAFYLLARKSNLVPDSVCKFDVTKQLTRGDVVVLNDSLLVTLKWSKTNQVGRKEVFPLLRNDDSLLCPVRAYTQMLRWFPGEGDSPVFLARRYGVVNSITYRQYQEKIKACVSAIGLDPAEYSSHSFRRGGATYAFQSGVTAELIKKLGDWRSDAYLEYIDCPLDDRWEAGRRIKSQLNRDARVPRN